MQQSEKPILTYSRQSKQGSYGSSAPVYPPTHTYPQSTENAFRRYGCWSSAPTHI